MTDQELQRERNKIDMKGDTLTKKDLPKFMQKAGHSNLVSEIREDGLGEAINRILDITGKIYVDEVLKWAHIEKNGKSLIHVLVEFVFPDVHLTWRVVHQAGLQLF